MVPLHGRAKDRFSDFWRSHIGAASDPAAVLSIVRVYLAAWSPPQLASLPHDLGNPSIPNLDSLMARAVTASRAELKAPVDDPARVLLEEMALTLAAAAERVRVLTSEPPTELGALRDLLTELEPGQRED